MTTCSSSRVLKFVSIVIVVLLVWISSQIRSAVLIVEQQVIVPPPPPPPVVVIMKTTPSPPVEAKAVSATPYTTWSCVASSLSVPSGSINTSCMFENLYYYSGRFVVYATKDAVKKNFLPEKVAIGSVPEILYPHCTFIVTDTLPHDAPTYAVEAKQILYISTIVPWNYAHTLFSDLFPAFWMMHMFNVVTTDALVLCSDFFKKTFALPNKNNAWKVFSTVSPNYKAYHLDPMQKTNGGVRLSRILMGSGGKGWAHFHPSYRSPGSPELWWDFRLHLYAVTGASPPPERANGAINVLICRKKDKRRIANPDAVAKHIRETYPTANVRIAEFTQLTAKEQLEMFSNTTIFISNEGTSATYFFLMPRGSAFISVAQYYGAQWRPNAKKRTGGSVDWFPPAIDWVRTTYYEDIDATEVVRDINVVVHNQNAEFSVNMNLAKFAPIFGAAVSFVSARKDKSDTDGYTTTGRICKALFTAKPMETLQPMLSRQCNFPASYFCEFVANSPASERGGHYKYRSKVCYRGNVDVPDPRK